MTTRVKCAACNAQIDVPDHMLGRQGRCPGCGLPMVAPDPSIATTGNHTAAATVPVVTAASAAPHPASASTTDPPREFPTRIEVRITHVWFSFSAVLRLVAQVFIATVIVTGLFWYLVFVAVRSLGLLGDFLDALSRGARGG